MTKVNEPIRDAVQKQLEDSRLDKQELDKPGAHVVVPGQSNDEVHVLVKKTGATKAVDTLEAEIRGEGNARRGLAVKEEGEIDLGELGKWRDFSIIGLDPNRYYCYFPDKRENRITIDTLPAGCCVSEMRETDDYLVLSLKSLTDVSVEGIG